MPIYEYECTKCKKQSEELHGMTANPKVKCESCGGKCQRVVSKVHMHGLEKGSTIHYRIEKAMEKGSQERAAAAEQSHMGADPYGSMPDIAPDIVDSI